MKLVIVSLKLFFFCPCFPQN